MALLSKTVVGLVSCPPWTLSGPPVSIPVLAAACMAQGIHTRIVDANASFYNWLLRRETVLTAASHLSKQSWQQPIATSVEALNQRALAALAPSLGQGLNMTLATLRGRKHSTNAGVAKAHRELGDVFALLSSHFGELLDADTLEAPALGNSFRQFVRAARETPWALVDSYAESVIVPALQDTGVVAFSVHTQEHLVFAIRVALALRSAGFDVPIVVGGTFLTTYAAHKLKMQDLFDLVDYVILHDGEEALPTLVRHIQAGGTINDVPNCLYMAAGQLRYTFDRLAPSELTSLCPTLDGIDLDQYNSQKPLVSIPIARGCFYDCAYCNYPALGSGRFRVDPARIVADKVEAIISRYGVNSFIFSVSVMPPIIARNIARELERRKIEITWATGARFERKFTPELCDQLQQTGCRRIDFGVETGSSRLLDKIHKKLSVADYEFAASAFAQTSINQYFYFIANLPTESEEDFIDTTNLARRLAPQACGFNFFPFANSIGSPIDSDPSRYSLTAAPQPEFATDDFPLVVQLLDKTQTAASNAMKAEQVRILAEDLGSEFENSGLLFHRRGIVPDFGAQVVLPDGARIIQSQVNLDSDIEKWNIGRAVVNETSEMEYYLLRSRTTGKRLIASESAVRSFEGGRAENAEAVIEHISALSM